MRAAAELRLHTDDEVEELFALNDLSGGLPADGGGDNGFDIGNVDAVARDLVAIDIDQQARLAELAHNGEVGKARNSSTARS